MRNLKKETENTTEEKTEHVDITTTCDEIVETLKKIHRLRELTNKLKNIVLYD